VALAGVALLALFSVPIFSTVLPPLFDYPNHLARFLLLLTGGNSFYEVRWVPLPNLAGDLIVPLLARLIPLEFAGKLFLVLSFALIVGGAVWLNRLVSGGWRLWPLLTAAFLYNRQFLWGFINYLFGLGIALCGVALWLALEHARAWLRLCAAMLVALWQFDKEDLLAGLLLFRLLYYIVPFALSLLILGGRELLLALRGTPPPPILRLPSLAPTDVTTPPGTCKDKGDVR